MKVTAGGPWRSRKVHAPLGLAPPVAARGRRRRPSSPAYVEHPATVLVWDEAFEGTEPGVDGKLVGFCTIRWPGRPDQPATVERVCWLLPYTEAELWARLERLLGQPLVKSPTQAA